jgi:N6-adenosine-specific RNA methylase IME4
VWVKDKIGMGYYFRQQHELLLVAGRGKSKLAPPEGRVSSVIEAPRGKHSEKPQHVYEILEAMYPDSSRVEMFARVARDGWDAWGNET